MISKKQLRIIEYDSDGWASTTWLMGENQSVAQNGSGYAYNNTSTSAAGKNDWLFSYPIYLKNGETVTVKYHTAIGSEEAEPATLKVAVASAPDKSNISVNLSTQTVSQQTYTEHTVSYTATADQVYYIGFGNTTPKVTTTTALRLDNISFTKNNLAVIDINKTNIKTYPNPVIDFLISKLMILLNL